MLTLSSIDVAVHSFLQQFLVGAHSSPYVVIRIHLCDPPLCSSVCCAGATVTCITCRDNSALAYCYRYYNPSYYIDVEFGDSTTCASGLSNYNALGGDGDANGNNSTYYHANNGAAYAGLTGSAVCPTG
ncbi:unnamed protein product [Adineta steineri]|uniref:Uncharacterized protein n=1 Tax=Adineta steineri TaxID=433720 RepID=A0A813NR10_9BILA|nr:unnamed protein product [Adineta steineri]